MRLDSLLFHYLIFNPLVPSVHFLDVFPVFLSKRRCSSQRIFSMKPSKSPLSIFLSTGANLKIIGKKADLLGPKNGRPFWPEKFFFDFFMLRRLESVFKAKKIFLKKIFFEFFVKFDGEHQSGAAPTCDQYRPKSSAWHFYL